MEITNHHGSWWVSDVEPYSVDGEGPYTEYGPYDTKKEAEAVLRGVERFYKYELAH